ncbi:hypothetical protein G3N95_35085 [Paraburkholderia sp. Tr-20389]|uniref:hypothetical protein n=1 Tax=Paraburkholderia sp. Tr-20389 TaxID=2703903 RepID=UPI00197FFC47|nr:hypothetical protein [Paraburkholderia sp. Tr-20389]MBN3758186.1 hypothetical protein [Paraburkholderia sp. Tr-20389]
MEDSEQFSIPEGVGPHEGAEYRLMAEGKKHVAMFSDCIPVEFFENPLHLDLGVLENTAESCTVFYMPGYREEAERLMVVNAQACNAHFKEDLEREIGRILGYEDWQIEAFLAHVNSSKR